MAMAGSRLQASTESALPAGLIDILPTLLVLLDLPVPPHIQGRVLTEAFRGAGANAGEAVDASIDIPGQSRQLIRERVGDTYYLNRLQHRAD
jgi:arylsulfatase A-like enzyme